MHTIQILLVYIT